MDILPSKYKDIPRLIKDLKNRPAEYWEKRGEKRALSIFKSAAQRVPAYKDFLKKQKINPSKIKTIKDFKLIPTIDKQDYLRKYPLSDLCWDGKLGEGRYSVAATSGSTGQPFYFPRTEAQDLQYAGTAELYLRTNFNIDKLKTLYVNAFPMGIWIGGVFTYEAITTVARRNKFGLSIVNPGIDKKEIIRAITTLGPYFDQVLIGCYGPFLKDVLDDGIDQGIDWKKYNLKFIFSAEGFSEEFRDRVVKLGGLHNPYLDTLNHYGTVDQGTLGYETPLAIWMRKKALKNKKLYEKLFTFEHHLPTLVQYDPELFYFEELDSGVICTAASGLPLIRYDLKDAGGIFRYKDILQKFYSEGINLEKEFKKDGLGRTLWRLPFAYVYERKDFSVSFYAFQIYPETIRKAVQQRAFLRNLTGKFTLISQKDKNQNPELCVHIELRPGHVATAFLEKRLREAILKSLLADSSEFRETYSKKLKAIVPRVIFWKYEDPTHFRPGGKQKWSKITS